MKKKNGFTLVELLAVIILIGLLMALVIPSALKLSSKVKERAYATKIDLIEAAAKSYGQSNIGFIKKGTDPNNTDRHYTCKFTYNTDDTIKSIAYTLKTYSETTPLSENEYWCVRRTVADLVGAGDLDYDEKGKCAGNCNAAEKTNYDNIVINPKTNFIINKCFTYVYYKYNRVYVAFDEATCSKQTDIVSEGHEYRPLFK